MFLDTPTKLIKYVGSSEIWMTVLGWLRFQDAGRSGIDSGRLLGDAGTTLSSTQRQPASMRRTSIRTINKTLHTSFSAGQEYIGILGTITRSPRLLDWIVPQSPRAEILFGGARYGRSDSSTYLSEHLAP